MWTALTDQLANVAHSFRHNKWRSFLTLLGMIIGSGSMVLLAGLLAGAEEALLLTHQFIGDANVIQANPAPAPTRQRLRTQRQLDQRDRDGLDRHPALLEGEAWGELTDWSRWARVGARKKRTLVLGATERAAELYRVEVARGRFLDAHDLRTQARVCVVGDEVWRELLGAPDKLEGVSLRVSGLRWEVVGALKRKPALVAGLGTWMWDRRIVVPATTFASSIRRTRGVDALYVRLPIDLGRVREQTERVEGARRMMSSMLLRRHHGVENFKIQGLDKGEKQQEQLVFDIINVLLFCTAVLSLFVGGINIMNIMLVTVTERTREIGLRQAIGATRGTILRQFLLEATMMAGVGGAVGVLGGAATVWLASKGLGAWLGFWPAHYKAWAMILGFASSAFVGLVFGIYPAWRATCLTPAEALRQE